MNSIKLQDHEYFTGDIIKVLAQNRITTILEFIQTDAEKLSLLTKLNLAKILEIRNVIFSQYSAPLISGFTLFTKSLTCRKYISTGIASLDLILNGGISIGQITEVYGLAGSGKSQLCMQLAINSVKDLNNTALYIDTKGDFSAIRVQKILDANKFSHKDMALIMTKIKVIHIWYMEHLINFLESIKLHNANIENLSLIIIDSLPSLVLQHFGDNNKYGLIYLNKIVNLSRYICKELNVGLICVNIQTRWIDIDIREAVEDEATTSDSTTNEKRNRGLGKYWHHIPAVLILVEKKNDPLTESAHCANINVSVMKNTSPLCVKSCELKISLLGIT